MCGEKFSHSGKHDFRSIFEQIMPGFVNFTGFRLGKDCLELLQELRRETPVPHPPHQQEGMIPKLRKAFLNFEQSSITRMFGVQRDILNESGDGLTVPPSVIRS